MTRRVYFYFVATLVLGIVLGGAGVYYYGWSSGHWRRPFNRNHAIARLKSNLSLDDNQVQQVQQILDDGFHRMRELQKAASRSFRRSAKRLATASAPSSTPSKRRNLTRW